MYISIETTPEIGQICFEARLVPTDGTDDIYVRTGLNSTMHVSIYTQKRQTCLRFGSSHILQTAIVSSSIKAPSKPIPLVQCLTQLTQLPCRTTNCIRNHRKAIREQRHRVLLAVVVWFRLLCFVHQLNQT